jgi:2-polyprenyl-3-methyl-5-hydroxy-6-metoxy-1,4-benzoquinol methylase
MDLKETYNRIGENWNVDHANDVWWIEGTDAFIQSLPQGAHVLDVGCATGLKSKYLIEHGFQVHGIDIADTFIEIAKREVPEGSFQELSMMDLDSLTDTFDGVFAQASLLHIPKKDAGEAVQKMARRLVSQGILYIAVKESKEGLPDEGILKEQSYGFEYERFFSYFTMKELESYLAAAGIAVVSEFRNPSPSGKTVWLQIIGRK